MIIATRVLTLRRSSDAVELAARLFAPEQDGTEWRCRYEIDWPEGQRASFAVGIDAVQALHLTLQKIGIDLYMSEHHASGGLVWMRPGQGYGFPVPKNGRAFLIGEDKRFEG
jgi:hypothetical protein